jgi:hypothetical protein
VTSAVENNLAVMEFKKLRQKEIAVRKPFSDALAVPFFFQPIGIADVPRRRKTFGLVSYEIS